MDSTEIRNNFMNALDCYIDAKHTVLHEDRGYVSLDLATKNVLNALDVLIDALSIPDKDNS